jgi:putative flippase GtrA
MVNKLFKDPTESLSIQAFRYMLAGTLAYVVDYSTLAALVETFKFYYLTAAAIAFLLGAAISYTLNVAWVFNRRVFKDMRLEIAIFLFLALAGLCLNHYCIRFFTEAAHIHYLGSKFISMIIVSTMNFYARKSILFR